MTSERGTRVHEEICGARGSRRDSADHRKRYSRAIYGATGADEDGEFRAALPISH